MKCANRSTPLEKWGYSENSIRKNNEKENSNHRDVSHLTLGRMYTRESKNPSKNREANCIYPHEAIERST